MVGAYEAVRIMRGTPILMRGAALMGAQIFFMDLATAITGLPIAITGFIAITGRPMRVGTASDRFSGRMLSVIEREYQKGAPQLGRGIGHGSATSMPPGPTIEIALGD